MTVYVESNFVLECALQQEESDSCLELIQLSTEGKIRLAIPAFSLAEPHSAIQAKDKVRTRLSYELKAHLSELGRSKHHRDLPGTYKPLSEALTESAQLERDGLRNVTSEILSAAEVIVLDTAILLAAENIQTDVEMSGQDAIVLASVLSHLNLHAPPVSCFLNRNALDFDRPEARRKLAAHGCKVLTSFEDGLRYVQSKLG